MRVPFKENFQKLHIPFALLKKFLPVGSLVIATLVCTVPGYAQNIIHVKGRIVNESGQPVSGASIVVKGSGTGVTSQENGSFEIDAAPKGILVISYVGMVEQELKVATSPLSVTLISEESGLNQVVVVGYGSQKKSDITGSVATVSSKALQETPTANIINSLKGRAAGVDIVSNSTAPGSSGQIRIRGNRSLVQEIAGNPSATAANNDALNGPLLVVDGIPYGGSVNDLNPDDISGIDILKDASATAIYGSRGSNGVLIITTNRGRTGKAVMSYNGYFGLTNALGEYKGFNGPEYAAYKDEAKAGNSVNPGTSNYGLSADETANLANGVSTDWQKLIYRQGYTTSHGLSLSGGNESTLFSLSGGYFREVGIIPGQDFSRYSLRTTIDHKISRRLKIGLNTMNSLAYTNSGGNPVGGLLRMSPLTLPYNADGSLNLLPLAGLLDAATVNPLTIIKSAGSIVNNNRRLRTFNSLYGEWEIIDALKYRVNLGLDYRQDQSGSYLGPNTFYNNSTSLAQASESVGNAEAWTYIIENLLTYDKTFREKHHITLTGLYSVQKDHNQASGIYGTGIPADYIQNYNLSLANTVSANTATTNPWAFSERGLISYMARLNYAYDNRYLLTATVRRDGSSVLSPGNQYFTYPAFAVGWNILNEKFMNNTGMFSALKLRGGWGLTSSQSINPYATLGLLGTNAYNFGPGTAGQNAGYLVQTLANKALKWQSTAQTNIGLDFGILQNRITGSIDVYTQRTNDILLPESLPASNGAGSTIVNAGKTKGHGVEVGISSINVRTPGGFTWSTDLNFSISREEIVALQDPTLKSDLGNGWFVGQPLSVIYDVKKSGIWQTADSVQAKSFGQKPGQIRPEDISGPGNDGKPDGKITADDRQIIGNFQPQWEGGLTNRFAYKGFDLSVVMFARMGMKVVVPYLMSDGGAQGYDFFNNSRVNSLKRDYWTPTNPTNKFPRPDAASDGTNYSSTLGYVDGSFIKIRNIILGYNLPAQWLNKAGISSLRIYFSAQNPFILYSPFVKDGYGPDTEGNGYGGVSTSTVGGTPVPGRAITVNLTAPSTRQFNFGVNLKF